MASVVAILSTNDMICDFVESVRESGGKVLIHCRAGISRSATVCIAYLMYGGRLSLDEAHDYLKHCRPLISPNLNFMRQLAEFEACLTADGDCSSRVGDLRRASDDLVARIVGHCASRLRQTTSENGSAALRQMGSDSGETALPKHRSGPEVEICVRKKRKLLSDLLLPCGPAPAKVSRVGLQPPPTPCMKQAFVFDLATVAVLMSGHGNAGSPSLSQSPLVSPS